MSESPPSPERSALSRPVSGEPVVTIERAPLPPPPLPSRPAGSFDEPIRKRTWATLGVAVGVGMLLFGLFCFWIMGQFGEAGNVRQQLRDIREEAVRALRTNPRSPQPSRSMESQRPARKATTTPAEADSENQNR